MDLLLEELSGELDEEEEEIHMREQARVEAARQVCRCWCVWWTGGVLYSVARLQVFILIPQLPDSLMWRYPLGCPRLLSARIFGQRQRHLRVSKVKVL